jgi:hypothetical protein
MSRSANDGRVVVLLNGPTERLVLDTLALLAQDYPSSAGSGFERAVARLSSRVAASAAAPMMSGFVVLLSEMGSAGKLPRIRRGRARPATQDELFLVALISAAQRGDKGRAIEAAIALLDSGYVHRVVAAAKLLGARLAENGLVLARIGAPTFDYVAGYPVVENPVRAASVVSPPAPTRPTLRLLESA